MIWIGETCRYYTSAAVAGNPVPSRPRGAEGAISFLLIAAGTEAQENAYNTLFAETLGLRAELWVAPGAAHTGAYALLPSEWETRVLGFFGDVLR